uniref:EOG090X0CWG n=1 Tax=Alona affinis TaxID=381656 RepID=A0A9N6WP99_9CRUS|nr:EOG090X0CWG [Alona affinis]
MATCEKRSGMISVVRRKLMTSCSSVLTSAPITPRLLQDSSSSDIKKEHILSSNLGSLRAIVDILEKCVTPISVLKVFQNGSGPASLVDVVSNSGAVWYKAIARKPEALQDICKGRTSCGGQKSVIEQAKDYLLCAQQHPYHFNPPKVIFFFSNGISTWMAQKLAKIGIEIEGNIVEIEESSIDYDSDDESSSNITCMVAYVSSMTNGRADLLFPKPIYNQQAEWERREPAKPKLDALFDGKQLTIGGPGEKQRAAELVQRLRVVEDTPSERVVNLQLTSNVKVRSRIIFGTADQLRIVIVTANSGFLRSAAGQGTQVAHFLHEPRVLTEQQEPFAVPLNQEDN